MLKRCIEKDLVQNWRSVSSWQIWEWSLAYIISKDGIKVDHAKVELFVKLPATTTIKAIRQLLGHVSLNRRFIKDFLRIS